MCERENTILYTQMRLVRGKVLRLLVIWCSYQLYNGRRSVWTTIADRVESLPKHRSSETLRTLYGTRMKDKAGDNAFRFVQS